MKSARRLSKKKKEDVPSTAGDLKEITHEEFSGADTKDSSLENSSVDEDESEGLADGKIGRREDDPLAED